MHQVNHYQHTHVGNALHEKISRPAEQYDHGAAQSGADDLHQIKPARVERDGVDEIVLGHDARDHALAHGLGERPGDTGDQGKNKDMRHVQERRCDESAHAEGSDDQNPLSAQQQLAPVHAIGSDTGHRAGN